MSGAYVRHRYSSPYICILGESDHHVAAVKAAIKVSNLSRNSGGMSSGSAVFISHDVLHTIPYWENIKTTEMLKFADECSNEGDIQTMSTAGPTIYEMAESCSKDVRHVNTLYIVIMDDTDKLARTVDALNITFQPEMIFMSLYSFSNFSDLCEKHSAHQLYLDNSGEFNTQLKELIIDSTTKYGGMRRSTISDCGPGLRRRRSICLLL
jgi:hypothetical protein